MKRLGLVVAILLSLPGCAAVCDFIGPGVNAIDEVVADGVGLIPVVGQIAAELTGIGFAIVRTTVCAPEIIGEEIQETIGVTLDPTRVTDDPPDVVPGDPGDS